MQCDVRCMERYVILDVWDGLHVDYVVVSDVWKSSYVNKIYVIPFMEELTGLCDIKYMQ